MASLTEIEQEIDQLDRLNKVTGVDVAPHAAAVDRLKAIVGGYFEDMREQFAIETDGASAGDFLEALQNLFEIYLGDDLFEQINSECPAARADSALSSRIYSELMRHVARLALSAA